MGNAKSALRPRHPRAAGNARGDRRLHEVAAVVAAGANLKGAACIGHVPLYDATVHRETTEQREERHCAARAICGTCPVWSRCKDAADATPRKLLSGVWVGIRWNLPRPAPGDARPRLKSWRGPRPDSPCIVQSVFSLREDGAPGGGQWPV